MVRRTTRSPAQRAAWLHNQFLGYAKCTMKQMDQIITASTTTDESQALAADIYQNAMALSNSLRIRRTKENRNGRTLEEIRQ